MLWHQGIVRVFTWTMQYDPGVTSGQYACISARTCLWEWSESSRTRTGPAACLAACRICAMTSGEVVEPCTQDDGAAHIHRFWCCLRLRQLHLDKLYKLAPQGLLGWVLPAMPDRPWMPAVAHVQDLHEGRSPDTTTPVCLIPADIGGFQVRGEDAAAQKP